MTPTREEILAMAKAAEVVGKNNTGSGYTFDRFVAFANLAYAAGQRDMRERAAEMCTPSAEHRLDACWGYLGGEEGVALLDGVAEAIRNLEINNGSD